MKVDMKFKVVAPPDVNSCTVGVEGSRYAEVLFPAPTFFSFLSNMMCDVDIRKKLYAVCRVVCGTAMFQGIDEHMEK